MDTILLTIILSVIFMRISWVILGGIVNPLITFIVVPFGSMILAKKAMRRIKAKMENS